MKETVNTTYIPRPNDNSHRYIFSRIGKAASYEQLAEEASELAQAALKCARVIRNENPTPIEMKDAKKNLIEEFSDVILMARELDLKYSELMMRKKLKRFEQRWREKEEKCNISS